MDADQIVGCIDYITSCWPWATWEERTVVQWTDALAGVEVAHAREVAKRARNTLETPPSIAWFLAEVREVKLRDAPVFKALPEPEVDPESVAAILASTRNLLTAQAGREHNHKGPDPCSVCGGLVGTMGDQRGRSVDQREEAE